MPVLLLRAPVPLTDTSSAYGVRESQNVDYFLAKFSGKSEKTIKPQAAGRLSLTQTSPVAYLKLVPEDSDLTRHASFDGQLILENPNNSSSLSNISQPRLMSQNLSTASASVSLPMFRLRPRRCRSRASRPAAKRSSTIETPAHLVGVSKPGNVGLPVLIL